MLTQRIENGESYTKQSKGCDFLSLLLSYHSKTIAHSLYVQLIVWTSQKKRAALQSPGGSRGDNKHVIGLKKSPLIEFVLRRHPQETAVDRLRREYLRTSQDITMKDLKDFLGKKLSYFPHSDFQVGDRISSHHCW